MIRLKGVLVAYATCPETTTVEIFVSENVSGKQMRSILSQCGDDLKIKALRAACKVARKIETGSEAAVLPLRIKKAIEANKSGLTYE